jgi:hypothetical protein
MDSKEVVREAIYTQRSMICPPLQSLSSSLAVLLPCTEVGVEILKNVYYICPMGEHVHTKDFLTL